MKRSSSLEKIAFTGFGLAVLGVLALAGIAWNFTRQTLDASAFVGHTQDVIATLGAAEAQLFRAEAAQRAWLAGPAPEQEQQREVACVELRLLIDQAAELTADNPAQQRRIGELRRVVLERIDGFRRTQARLLAGTEMSFEARLRDGVGFRERLYPMFEALIGEERRLLALRQQEEGRRIDAARLTFVALALALALLLPLTGWRLRSDLAARQRAEAAAEEERLYDAAHARALTLFNAKTDRQEALSATLALLAEGALFPVSAFYAHEEWGGQLRLAASHGAPADIRPLLRLEDGPIGAAARSGEPVYLESFEPGLGFTIETGLASLKPAALLMSPVQHQGKLLGVLALATSARLAARDRAFVERLCAQLGVALHNLAQVEGLEVLAEELRKTGEDVRSKNEQLERASRTKSEFVANMSHELRTPLNAVIGFSEILHDGLAGELTAEQKEYVGDIFASGKHLLSLINDILDLSKIEAGQMDLELTPALPAELAASGLAVVREKAALRRIRVEDHCAPGLPRLCLDVRRAKQIVFNLLANAVKFTPDGGSVTLALTRVPAQRLQVLRAAAQSDDCRLFMPHEPTGDWLEIAVADTGIGIHPAGLRELFQPFVQIDSSLARAYEGTGLGLTMVQHLAELHGGALMVRSTPHRGSTFTVWFPWREPTDAAALAAAPAPGLPAPADAPLILVIEDDPRAASVLRLQLQAHGYRVEAAVNAEAGLERALALAPQAIVLDVILPGMDGWNVLSRLKEEARTARIPVVIVSITDEPRRGFALGAAQVLMKPVSQEDLVAALAAVGLQPVPAGGRVLVVDDDPKAVTLVCKQLESAGFVPQAAYGGQQALDFVRREAPDLIVLDLMMPNVSGFDVVEALARNGGTAHIPILVLTAKLVSAQDREQLRGRVQRVMEKAEFQPASLLAEVKRALARRHAA